MNAEPLAVAGKVHLLGMGSKTHMVRISTTTLERFEPLGHGAPEDGFSHVTKGMGPR